jgi:ABC transporter substrate binding protein
MAEEGALIAYGASFSNIYRRVAKFVVKVFSGENPGDIPAEQPTNFELIINLKAAQAIGIIFQRGCHCVPIKSSNEAQAPARPADGPRQYAPARRAGAQIMLPDRPRGGRYGSTRRWAPPSRRDSHG